MIPRIYPSDLTDAEWHHLEPLLPLPKSTGRPRQWDLRLILNGIFYLLRSGCAWRMLPQEYPPWPTVHDYYRRWRMDGTWERIHSQIRDLVRQAVGRETTPSGAVLDSQSIKTTEKGALVVPARSALTAIRRSRAASVMFWLIPRGWCSKSKPPAHTCLNALGRVSSWSQSRTSYRAFK